MKDHFTPDYMFASYLSVTPAFLHSIGVRAVLSDIDNTLAPYEQAKSDEQIRTWLRELNEAGISIALISNNHADRVELFNSDLGLIAYPDAGKPFGKCLRRAMTALGSDPSNTAMLGDQLLTDALAGHLQHLKVLIVPPIRDKRTAFVRFKRMLERPVIRRYYKKHGEEKR
jgi:HAD superfamily phosphatase (TIGR01668 family)